MRINNQMNYQTPNFKACAAAKVAEKTNPVVLARVFRVPIRDNHWEMVAEAGIVARTSQDLAYPLTTRVGNYEYFAVRQKDFTTADEVLNRYRFKISIPSVEISESSLTGRAFHDVAKGIAESRLFEKQLRS